MNFGVGDAFGRAPHLVGKHLNGTIDQLICDAQRTVGDAQIALSPGFRWGTTIVPGEMVTMERVLDQTATTYPETYVREMTGADLKLILEDVADNLFNPDPYSHSRAATWCGSAESTTCAIRRSRSEIASPR